MPAKAAKRSRTASEPIAKQPQMTEGAFLALTNADNATFSQFVDILKDLPRTVNGFPSWVYGYTTRNPILFTVGLAMFCFDSLRDGVEGADSIPARAIIDQLPLHEVFAVLGSRKINDLGYNDFCRSIFRVNNDDLGIVPDEYYKKAVAKARCELTKAINEDKLSYSGLMDSRHGADWIEGMPFWKYAFEKKSIKHFVFGLFLVCRELESETFIEKKRFYTIARDLLKTIDDQDRLKKFLDTKEDHGRLFKLHLAGIKGEQDTEGIDVDEYLSEDDVEQGDQDKDNEEEDEDNEEEEKKNEQEDDDEDEVIEVTKKPRVIED